MEIYHRKKKKFFNHGKQNEKGRLRMTETLAKRHTKQSEKHVTVYLLENGFQVAWVADSKREKGVTISQHRKHSMEGERRKKTKDEFKFQKIQAVGIAIIERKRLRLKIKQGN